MKLFRRAKREVGIDTLASSVIGGKTCVGNTAAGAAPVKEVSPALEYPTCPSHRRTSKSFGVVGL